MKKVMAAVLASAMALSMAACGGAPKAETPAETPAAETPAAEATQEAPAEATQAPAEEVPESTAERITINVGYMPNYASLWALETGINKGYFDNAGIDVQLTEFQDGPTIIAAMESGSVDVGYIGPGAHKLCINGNAKIFSISSLGDADWIIGGPDVKTLEDLKGKKVGYASGTSSEDILKLGLDRAGLTMADIEAVDMDAASLVTSMLSGGVDACAAWSPSTVKIMDEMPEATKLCSNVDFSETSVSPASYIVLPKWVETREDDLRRFTKALHEAMDYAAADHYDEVAQWVADQCKIDYDTAYAQRSDGKWFSGEEIRAGIQDGSIEGYYKLQQDGLLAAGAVEKEVPVSEYVLFDIMAGN